MTDIFTPEKRSQIMANIKGKQTKLEERGWAALVLAGVRFRKHPSGIPGKPDAGNRARKVAIFFDSEFWHGFDWQKRRRAIKSNRKFWVAKIARNIERDRKVNRILRKAGWKVIRIWEKDLQPRRVKRTVKKLEKMWSTVK